MAAVTLRNITKDYGESVAVKGINLDIRDHEFTVLVGPSGCGKTTTLRMIAGLESITSGELRIGDHIVNDLGPGQRDIAMVFQNYALYPHMTVADNISFGLRQRRVAKAEIATAVREAARLLEIEPLLQRKPRALSGGQRQRVAMGRAIVRNPQVFLFDEPLSNLDAKLRVQMRSEIKRLHGLVPTTTVYVTHDQVEAMTMADRVVVMNNGVIEQVGPPNELYNAPATRFVAEFIGSPGMNLFAGQLRAEGERLSMTLAAGEVAHLPVSRPGYRGHVGHPMLLGLRPEALSLRASDVNQPLLTAAVTMTEPLGFETIVYFDYDGRQLCFRADADAAPQPGRPVQVFADLNKMHLIDPATDRVVKGVEP